MHHNKHPERVALRWNLLEGLAVYLFRGDPTLENLRTEVLGDLSKFLYRIGITPNRASILGLACAITAAFTLNQPAIAAGFAVLSLFWDGIDGVIARINNLQSRFGSILDVSCDTIGTISIIFSFFYNGYIDVWILSFSVFVLLFYTLFSALKSQAIAGAFRSVGSRITIGSAVILILGLAAFNPSEIGLSLVWFNYVLNTLVFMLMAVMILDVRNILKLIQS